MRKRISKRLPVRKKRSFGLFSRFLYSFTGIFIILSVLVVAYVVSTNRNIFDSFASTPPSDKPVIFTINGNINGLSPQQILYTSGPNVKILKLKVRTNIFGNSLIPCDTKFSDGAVYESGAFTSGFSASGTSQKCRDWLKTIKRDSSYYCTLTLTEVYPENKILHVFTDRTCKVGISTFHLTYSTSLLPRPTQIPLPTKKLLSPTPISVPVTITSNPLFSSQKGIFTLRIVCNDQKLNDAAKTLCGKFTKNELTSQDTSVQTAWIMGKTITIPRGTTVKRDGTLLQFVFPSLFFSQWSPDKKVYAAFQTDGVIKAQIDCSSQYPAVKKLCNDFPSNTTLTQNKTVTIDLPMVGQKTYTIPKDTQIKRDGNILFLSYAIPNFSIDMKIKECNDMGAYGVILVFAGLASVPVPPLALSFMTAAGGMAIGQLNCALSFF